MPVTLEIQLPNSRVDLGGEIVIEITLTNVGTDAVETASLFDNNNITNVVLCNDRDEALGTYNHITRQLLMEKTEPRTNDVRLVTLAPGGRETRSLNVCTWHWFTEPGVCLLRGLYAWDGNTVWSEPERLELLPVSLVSLDYQWSYHYGEKFLLHSSWVSENEQGGYTAYLRQSARFHPHVANFNPKLHERAKPFAPRVSFNASLVGGGPTWVAWVDEGGIEFVRTLEGVVDLGPTQIASGMQQLCWVGAPLATSSGDVHFFCLATAADGSRRVLVLTVDAQGGLRQTDQLNHDFSSAVGLTGISDMDGGYHLLWYVGSEVFCMTLDLQDLSAESKATLLWKSGKAISGLFVPPVLGEELTFACIHADDNPDAPYLWFTWLQARAGNNPLKQESFGFAGATSIESCSGVMNGERHVFAIVRSEQGIHYINPVLMQMMTVIGPDERDFYTHERLIVNPRNDVFCTANRVGYGLREWLLHSGDVEDFDEEEGDEDE